MLLLTSLITIGTLSACPATSDEESSFEEESSEEEEEEEADEGADNGEEAECSSDEDCGGFLVCLDGICYVKSCESDDDCDGELCLSEERICVFRCDPASDKCIEYTGNEDSDCQLLFEVSQETGEVQSYCS